MSILSLPEFKTYMGSQVVGLDDAFYQDCIDAAVEAASAECGRQFVVASGTPSARIFTSDDCLRFDDCVGTPVITVDGTVVSSSLYTLYPLNGRLSDGTQVPYTSAEALNEAPLFYSSTELVTVSADWGWTTIPRRVKEAVKLLAKDEAHQRDTRFGVAGFNEFGSLRAGKNTAAMNLLAGLRRGDTAPAFGIA